MIYKKILLVFLLLSTLVTLSLPTWAADQSTTAPNPICWKYDECEKMRADLLRKDIDNLTSEDKKVIGDGWVEDKDACPSGYGKCLPANVTITSISIAGKNKFLTIGDYLQTIYKFILGIVSILAAAMMVVAGAQWLTSGGNAESITSAKHRIVNALIGMVLAYTSYFILNTINPALVNLRLPQAYLVKPINQGGNEGALCKTDAECNGGLACIGAKNPPLVQALNVFGAGLVGLTGVLVTIPAGGSFAGAAEAVKTAATWTGGKAASFMTWKVGATVVGVCSVAAAESPVGCWDVTKGGGIAAWSGIKSSGRAVVSLYEYIKQSGAQGICLRPAKDLPNGAMCDKNEQCVSKSCLPAKGLSLITNEAGFCTDGKSGSLCACPNDEVSCSPGTCQGGLACVEGVTGPGLFSENGAWFCTDKKQGSPCRENKDCLEGLECRSTVLNGMKFCAVAQSKLHGEGESCKSNVDCIGSDKPVGDYSENNPLYVCKISDANKTCDEKDADHPCFCHLDQPASAREGSTLCYTTADCAAGFICWMRGTHDQYNANSNVDQGVGDCIPK